MTPVLFQDSVSVVRRVVQLYPKTDLLIFTHYLLSPVGYFPIIVVDWSLPYSLLGDLDKGYVSVGNGVSLIHEIKSVKEVVDELMVDFK